MPKIEFTPAELKEYFRKDNKSEYYYAERARELEVQMRVHADGVFPEELINERRPNEPSTVHDYRKKIFVAKTKPYFTKIESTLQKIRRSSDWSIKYDDMTFDRIVEGEKMNDYAEDNFPVFRSVTNWAFSLLLRNYLVDPNALALVAPLDLPEEENQFIQPVVTIFNSVDVIDFEDGDYAVVRNKLGAVYLSGGREMEGESYYIITTVAIHRWDQINGRGQFAENYYYEHGLEELPVFKLPGIVIDVYGKHSLHESRISGILPEFNEALREYSDLQAAKVLHLYPERWEYTNNECTNCKGAGRVNDVIDGNACQVACDTCQGAGYIASGPYSKIMIKPNQENMGQTTQIPTPPAGFVEKDVEIIKVQEESVQAHIFNALSAINFEFLASTPLNQSGTAKEVDKDELNNTVHAIAEDLVKVIDKVYWLIALYRYSTQYSKDEIYNMLPMIAVPEKYDILSTKYFDEQFTSAKKNSMNPAILNAMEIAYATKAFNNDGDIAELVGLILKLDPLAGIGEDDKMSRLTNEGITKLDYIVSSNINKFVNEAVDADVNFWDKETREQKDIIYEMAEIQIEEADIAKTVVTDIEEGEIMDEPLELPAPVENVERPSLDINLDLLIPEAAIVKLSNRMEIKREKRAIQREIDSLNKLIDCLWN